MAESQEILPSDWKEFFSSFSLQHDEELVTVEVMGSEIGAQIEGRQLHLRGISPAQGGEEPDLALMFDTNDGSHLTHMIAKPRHVWLLRARDDTDEALEIQSTDGTSTLVRLGPPSSSVTND